MENAPETPEAAMRASREAAAKEINAARQHLQALRAQLHAIRGLAHEHQQQAAHAVVSRALRALADGDLNGVSLCLMDLEDMGA